MKKFIKKIKGAFTSIGVKAQNKVMQAKAAIANTSGEGYIDTAVKIIIGVVVGAVILGGLYALFKTVVLPNMNTQIGNMFDYTA